MLRVLLTTLALAATACATTTRVAAQKVPPDLATVSAPLIGYTPDTTEIEDVTQRSGDEQPTAWIATCEGRAFYCFTEGSTSCTPVPGP